MAKNYSAIYNSGNDSIALEQKFFIVEEAVRGVLQTPSVSDFLYTLGGGSTNFSQPFESSPHRSGRSHNNIIKQKKITEWSLPSYFNIGQAGPIASSVDDPVLLLWEALLGTKNVGVSEITFEPTTTPSKTFSIFEVGDFWAKQSPGGFVNTCEATFDGAGQAQMTWGGNAKTSYLVGMGKCTSATGGNTITLQSQEGLSFPVGALVMLVDATDGVTRLEGTSAAPRTVTSVTGDVITVSGAALTTDGSVSPFLVVYFEPEGAITAIDNPLTGLVGSITAVNPSASLNGCVRTMTVSFNNNFELVDYCFGTDGLAGPLFVAGGRLDINVSMELNLNKGMVNAYNEVLSGDSFAAYIELGNNAENHFYMDIPRVIFSAPNISVPETGSIPVTFEGLAYQTALDANDPILVGYSE